MCAIPNAVTMYINLSGNLCFSFAARNKKKLQKKSAAYGSNPQVSSIFLPRNKKNIKKISR